MAYVLNFVQFLLMALWALVLGRMLMSWVDPTGLVQQVPAKDFTFSPLTKWRSPHSGGEYRAAIGDWRFRRASRV